MLPQLLVQNKLITNTDGSVDWTKAIPIVDLNFYYIWRLVDESEYYRSNQQPWTPVNCDDWHDLKVHQYCIAGADGSYHYRLTTDYWIEFTPVYYVYNYDETTGEFKRSTDVNLPVYIRNPFFGLSSKKQLPISSGKQAGTSLQFDITNEGLKFIINSEEFPLWLSTDFLRGRVILNQDGVDVNLANIPVTISRTPNTKRDGYLYYISIPNNSYPSNAKLELY